MLNDVSQITNTASTPKSGSTGSNKIDQTKTQFLTLLLAQLKNQDPLSPANTDQMTAQMMSLGQLEQLFDLNKNVEGLANMTSNSQLATYSSMVGKNALARGNSFEVKGTEKGSFNFELAHIPNSATIKVFDKYNNLVSEVDPQITNPGLQKFAFNGLDLNNKQLQDGYYTYSVEALNDDGQAIPVGTYTTGAISSIRLESGTPVFKLGNTDVGLADIERIY